MLYLYYIHIIQYLYFLTLNLFNCLVGIPQLILLILVVLDTLKDVLLDVDLTTIAKVAQSVDMIIGSKGKFVHQAAKQSKHYILIVYTNALHTRYISKTHCI